jgi:hypothetical protein
METGASLSTTTTRPAMTTATVNQASVNLYAHYMPSEFKTRMAP